MSTEAQVKPNNQNARQPCLTTAGDFIPTDEHEEFIAFTASYHACLKPIGIAEESCMLEVRSAAWRLRRCRALEAAPPPNITEESIERARAHAHNITRKAMLELRRLQAERQTQTTRPVAAESEPSPQEDISFCKNETAAPKDATGPKLVPVPPRIPRGGLCPCHSGRKYKRCCGQNAPPVLNRGSKQAA